MVSSGRVLVIEERACPETSRLWDAVRDEGYEIVTMPLVRTLEQATTAQRPDVVLLNMIAAEYGPERNRYLDAASRLTVAASARRLPVIGVGEAGEGGRPLGMSDVLPQPLSAGRLLGRIAALTRLSTMQAELRRRMETGGRFGLDVPTLETGISEHDVNILVIGNGGRFLTFESVLARMATLTGAFSMTTARDYMARRRFDLLLLDMPLSDAAYLASEIRRNPIWYSIPIMGFGDNHDAVQIDAAYRTGLTDILFGQFEGRELLERTRSAVNENRLREQLKSIYTQARHIASNDALTGLFTRGYMMEHLQHMVAEAQNGGDRFSVLGLRVSQLENLNETYGYAGGDQILRQIGITIARLVRGEDLAARAGGDRFAILLPSAGYEEAVRVSARISAVIKATRFTIPESDNSTSVDIETGYAIWTPTDDAKTLLARAFGPQLAT